METVRPIFRRLLLAAIAAYVIGTALLLSDLCYRVGSLEHDMVCSAGKRAPSHLK